MSAGHVHGIMAYNNSIPSEVASTHTSKGMPRWAKGDASNAVWAMQASD